MNNHHTLTDSATRRSLLYMCVLSIARTVLRICATAGAGTVVIGWSTGNGTIVKNQQAPYYPNATLYAPQTPDPASYNSTVSPFGHSVMSVQQ